MSLEVAGIRLTAELGLSKKSWQILKTHTASLSIQEISEKLAWIRSN